MKIQKTLILLVLSIFLLACSLDNFLRQIISQHIEYSPTIVISVEVDPPLGSGAFTLILQYDAIGEYNGVSTHYFPGLVTCNYTTPDGATILIGEVNPPFESMEGVIQTATLAFNVTQAGDYRATCTNHTGGRSADNTFIVQGTIPEETEPPVQIPTDTPEVAPPVVNLPITGQIIFDYASTQSARTDAGGEAAQVTGLCIPNVTITTDGILSGACEQAGSPSRISRSHSQCERDGGCRWRCPVRL